MKKTPEKFREWIEKKIEVEFTPHKRGKKGQVVEKDVRIGEFWRYYEGMNVGNEISKDERFLKVCLVLKTDMGNGLSLCCPITTKHRMSQSPYYIQIRSFQTYGLRECNLIIN